MLTPFAAPPLNAADASAGGRIPQILQDRAVGIVIAAFFTVHRELGHGFSESVYQRALALEFATRGLAFEQDAVVSVFYKGTRVGHHRSPFLVEGRVCVELRSSPRLDPQDERQLSQTVHAHTCGAGLLLHFGVAATFRHVDRADLVPSARIPDAHMARAD